MCSPSNRLFTGLRVRTDTADAGANLNAMTSTAAGRNARRVSERTFQRIAAASVTVAAVILALGAWWPFDSSPRALDSYEDPSLWQFLLSDRTTLGFARLGVIALMLYVLASVPALGIAARWLRGVGTGGVSADEAAEGREVVAALREERTTLLQELDEVKEERDEALGLARRLFVTLRGKK